MFYICVYTTECPEGFEDLGTGCYNMSFAVMPFGEALAYCTSLGSHLTYITSAQEQGNIEMYLDDNFVNGKSW